MGLMIRSRLHFYTGYCGGLSENVFHGSKYLDVLSSAGGAVWGGLRGLGLSEGSTPLWAGLETSETLLDFQSLPAPCDCLRM